MKAEQQCRKEILKALEESTQDWLTRGAVLIGFLRIVHTCDSVTFIYPDVFHLRFQKRGTGSIIETKDEGVMNVISKFPCIQLVRVFLKMLFSNSENEFSYLMLEIKDVADQPSQKLSEKTFLRLLVEVFEARDQLLKVRHLYTTKLVMKCFAEYMDPDRCESITILAGGGEKGEELDQGLLNSPIWRKLKRFVSLDQCLSRNLLEQCEHIPEFHVILRDEMKMEEILEIKQRLLQTDHLAHVSIYFKTQIRYSFMKSLFANLKKPLPIEVNPKLIYSCNLDENNQFLMTVDQNSIKFQGPKYTKNEIEEDITRKLFEDVIEKRETNTLVQYLMDQEQEEIFKELDEFFKERRLNLNDMDEKDKLTTLPNDSATNYLDSTASSDSEEILKTPKEPMGEQPLSERRKLAEKRPISEKFFNVRQKKVVDASNYYHYEKSRQIIEGSMQEATIIIETSGPSSRDQADSGAKRFEVLMEKQLLSDIRKFAKDDPEESLNVPQEKVADAPNYNTQESTQIGDAVEGLRPNEGLGTENPTADEQDRHHPLPADSLSKQLRSLQLVMENSSEEYKRGCQEVLNAAVSRFSGPNPPKSATEFFDEMIRRFQNSLSHNG